MSITLEQAQEKIKSAFAKDGNMYDAINKANLLKSNHIVKPSMPLLKDRHTSEDLKIYTEKFDKYEIEKAKYKLDKEKVIQFNSEIDKCIIDLILDESGLNKVPEKYRDKVLQKARNMSESHEMLYDSLTDLVDIFD